MCGRAVCALQHSHASSARHYTSRASCTGSCAEVAVKRLLLLAAVAATMAACSDSPSAPLPKHSLKPARPSNDLECQSGYIIAYDENGNPYCAPDGGP
jgi:hypothetical protein